MLQFNGNIQKTDIVTQRDGFDKKKNLLACRVGLCCMGLVG